MKSRFVSVLAVFHVPRVIAVGTILRLDNSIGIAHILTVVLTISATLLGIDPYLMLSLKSFLPERPITDKGTFESRVRMQLKIFNTLPVLLFGKLLILKTKMLVSQMRTERAIGTAFAIETERKI